MQDPYEREAAKAAIKVLQRELAEAREQRDALARACRKLDDILPSGTTNPSLIEFRTALAAVKGGADA